MNLNEENNIKKIRSAQYVKTFYEKHPEKIHKKLEYNKKWILKEMETNKNEFLEKRKLRHRRWYAKNKDKINLQCRNRYAINKDKINLQCRNRYAINKDKINLQCRNRYALKKEKIELQKEEKIELHEEDPLEKKIVIKRKPCLSKTYLKQKAIDNNLKKIQLKAEKFKSELEIGQSPD